MSATNNRPSGAARAARSLAGDTPMVAQDTAVDPETFVYAQWRDDMLDAIERQAATGVPFTCYDAARAHGIPDPDIPNRWGAAMRAAAKLGIVVPVHVVRLTRRRAHGSYTTVWIGAEHVTRGGAR